MAPLIELKAVSKTFHLGKVALEALQGISLQFQAGELAAIVGASGSGKSTLLHILGCLDQPTSGDYLLDGENVAHLDDDTLSEIRNQKIGFVFQTFNLVPHLNIVENVEVPLLYMGARRQQRHELCMEAIEQVGIQHRWRHAPNELSGGERQRVAIARAIVHRPRVILADEPTGNLDSRTGAEILNVLGGLHEAGRTVIIVTHDPAIAQSASRRVLIKDGSLDQDT